MALTPYYKPGEWEGTTAQEVATCCRMSAQMMGGEVRGPGWAQVKLDTLFVRDSDFIHDLAKDLAKSWGEVGRMWWEIKEANKLSAEENAKLRRLRSDAVGVASDMIAAMRHLRTHHPRRWASFEKMIKKQTVRKIMRGVKAADRGVVRSDIEWCAWYIKQAVGDDRLEKLLTLRAEMA